MAQLKPQTDPTASLGVRTPALAPAGALFRPLRLLYDSLPPAHIRSPSPDRYSSRSFYHCKFRPYPAQRTLAGVLRPEVVSLPEGRDPRELR